MRSGASSANRALVRGWLAIGEPAFHAPEDRRHDGGHIAVGRRGGWMEERLPVEREAVHAVDEQDVKVGAEVNRRVEPLDDCHGADLELATDSRAPAAPAEPGRDGGDHLPQNDGGQAGVVRQLRPEVVGNGQDPLPDGNARDHAVHQMRGEVAHLAADTAGAEPAPTAREGDGPCPAAVATLREDEPVGKDPAPEKCLDLRHDKTWQHGGVGCDFQIANERRPAAL